MRPCNARSPISKRHSGPVLDHFDTDGKRFLLDVAARLADVVQVVYLTDDPDTLPWAAEQPASEGDGPPNVEGIATVA